MLKNAPILLLDEATSALDSEIEFAITESLNDIMTGKTVIADAIVSLPLLLSIDWWSWTKVKLLSKVAMMSYWRGKASMHDYGIVKVVAS